MILPQFYTDDIIKRAILEDINYVDVASDYLISEEQRDEAYFVSKADGVLCGIDVAMRVLNFWTILLPPRYIYTTATR